MNKTCVLPKNTISLDNKQFILPAFNPSLLSNTLTTKSQPFPNPKLYEDEVLCKPNFSKIPLQNPLKKSDDFTHFLSIPLIEISDKIYALQEEMQNNTAEDLTDHYQESSLTHLTLCMLALNSEEQKKIAIKVLQENENEIKKIFTETKINLKGLGFFEVFSHKKFQKFTNGRILYVKIEENIVKQALEKLLDFLVKKLKTAGILKEEHLSHITYDKSHDIYKGDGFHITVLRARNERGFGVDKIMSKLGGFNLGSVEIKSLDLSTRWQYGEDGYYQPLHRIYIKK